MNNPNLYENHSGGAVGADSAFDEIGRTFGVINHYHYWYKKPNPKSLPEHEIEEFEYLEGCERIKIANKTLKRRSIDKYMNLLARNWLQVKNSIAIYAVSSLKSDTEVEGGTGWAVQMAIDRNKPVNVFDQHENRWYGFNGKMFVPINPPILTLKFAGIGTRNINQYGIDAIRELYSDTFKNNI